MEIQIEDHSTNLAPNREVPYGDGSKSGYFLAEIKYYKFFDRKRNQEPKKVEIIKDGPVWIPGSRDGCGFPLVIEKELEKRFQDEMFDIIDDFRKLNFRVIENKSFQNEFSENIKRTVIRKGNIFLSLSHRTTDEYFPHNAFLESPADYNVKRVFLEYEISADGVVPEEDEILIHGIKARILKNYGLLSNEKCPTCNLPTER